MKINFAITLLILSSFVLRSETPYEQKIQTGVLILITSKQAKDLIAREKLSSKMPASDLQILNEISDFSSDDNAARDQYYRWKSALENLINKIDSSTKSQKAAVGDDLKRTIFKVTVLEDLVRIYFPRNAQAFSMYGINTNSFSGRSAELLNQEMDKSYKPTSGNVLGKLVAPSAAKVEEYNKKYLQKVVDDQFKKDLFANPNKFDLVVAVLANDRSFMATIIGGYSFDALSEATRILYVKNEIDRLVELKMASLNTAISSKLKSSNANTSKAPLSTSTSVKTGASSAKTSALKNLVGGITGTKRTSTKVRSIGL